MARPQKNGIDYFYFDCDFFNNRKVRKIMKGCGPQSVAILSCLLCNIYKDGYYIEWDNEESTFDIADKIGVSDGAVSELVKKAIDADFFSKKMFEKHKILTSAAIQEIYFDACKRRDVIKYDKRLLLIKVNEYKNAVNVYNNPVNDSGGTQSKGNESKEENLGGEPPELIAFKKFQDWQKKNSPRVLNMKEPFTLEQYLEIKQKYAAEKLKELLIAMHNYKPLLTKNISSYLTLLNWAKKRDDASLTVVHKTEEKTTFNPALKNKIS